MSEIHNSKKRMPVILNPETESGWLQGASVKEFERPETNLVAVPV